MNCDKKCIQKKKKKKTFETLLEHSAESALVRLGENKEMREGPNRQITHSALRLKPVSDKRTKISLNYSEWTSTHLLGTALKRTYPESGKVSERLAGVGREKMGKGEREAAV